MSDSNLNRAREALMSLNLKGANQDIAWHWLSRWHNDGPPKIARFNRDINFAFKPSIMICQIKKKERLHCISGGAFIRIALGFDISNQDLLSLTPVPEREPRLDYWWQVVEGAVSVTYRQFQSKGRADVLAQGIGLPFADQDADGTRYFLMHTNWRPEGADLMDGNVSVDIQGQANRRMVRFTLTDVPDTIVEL